MSTPHEEIAAAIIAGQAKIMGPVATMMAGGVDGITVDTSGDVTITGDGAEAIERLVATYSGLTGSLGVRLCHQAAQPALAAHPDISLPVFAGL